VPQRWNKIYLFTPTPAFRDGDYYPYLTEESEDERTCLLASSYFYLGQN
jgi:hypothetical protein